MRPLIDAYVLHSRAFSDSKILLEMLTRSMGRVKAVARAPSKKNRTQYQMFQPLAVGFFGAGELKTVTLCEATPGRRLQLGGDSLFCALYINELVQRLTSLEDVDTPLFCAYETALGELSSTSSAGEREQALREFELKLLTSTGYGINLSEDSSGAKIRTSAKYCFDPNNGFRVAEHDGISGASLLAAATGDFSQVQTRQEIKRILRAALKPLLGERPIKSRELFRY